MKNKSFSYNLIIYFFAILVFLTMFFPLYGLILTSIQPENVIRSKNITFFPSSIVLYHFKEVLNPNHISPIYEGMRNSFIVSILTSYLLLISFTAFNFMNALFVFPLALITNIIPITIGNIGIREGATMYLLNNYSISPEIAFNISIMLFFLHSFIPAVFGLITIHYNTHRP